MKRFNGPLYHWLRKLWDFELPSWYPEHDACPEDAVPLCLNCLKAEDGHQWFCGDCGWPTSFNGTQMPFIKVHCLGAYFRSGVDGSVPLTPFRITGLVCTSLIQYHVFAPLYWYRLHQAGHGKYIQTIGLSKEPRWYLTRDAHEFSKYSVLELQEAYREMDAVADHELYQRLMDEFAKRGIDPFATD